MAGKLRSPACDGHLRAPDEEARIDSLVAATFSTPSGREVLQYLRDITINSVGGPSITDAELRHREGSRFLVGVIEQRMRDHARRQSDH